MGYADKTYFNQAVQIFLLIFLLKYSKYGHMKGETLEYLQLIISMKPAFVCLLK